MKKYIVTFVFGIVLSLTSSVAFAQEDGGFIMPDTGSVVIDNGGQTGDNFYVDPSFNNPNTSGSNNYGNNFYTDNTFVTPSVGSTVYNFDTQCSWCSNSSVYTNQSVNNGTTYFSSPATTYGSGSVSFGISSYSPATTYGAVSYGYTGSSWTGVTTNLGINCQAGTTLVNGNCQLNPVTTCQSGYSLVNGSCQLNTVTCPSGSSYVNGSCQINTTTCPNGSTLINGSCQITTVTCPNGSSLVNGSCQVNTTTCPTGTSLINGTCQVNTITCPSGSSLVNGNCQVNTTTCPTGTSLINGSCQITTVTCPTGSTLVNGNCQVNTTTCPSGSSLVNGVCQASVNCPSGTTYMNGTCVGQTNVTCPAGSSYVNGTCQMNTISCPSGSYLQNGICVAQTTSYTCPNGQVVSNLYACPVTYGNTNYYNNYVAPVIYQTCWDGTVIPNTSVCPSQYKVCANGTSIPVYQTCYVAPVPVYTPAPVIKFNNVVTSPVTQVTNTSARCNGIGLIAQGAQSTGWFEYGQTENLGRNTEQAIIGSSANAPFSNILTNLQPSTTYFCRAVMQNQYGLVKGEIVRFTTKSKVVNYVQPAPIKKAVTKTVKKNEIVCSDGSVVATSNQTQASMLNQGQKLVAIQLEKVAGDFVTGNNVTYRLSYKNLSNTALGGVEIKIVVPPELVVTSVPTGGYDSINHTISFSNLSLNPYSENVIEWSGRVINNAPVGKTVVTSAYVLYTITGTNVQDEVTAYTTASVIAPTDAQTLSGAENVIGTGHSFLPESLVEWLALIAILFILFILGRSIASSYKKGEEAHH